MGHFATVRRAHARAGAGRYNDAMDQSHEFYTASAAAQVLGISAAWATRLCREGTIRATKHGKAWMIAAADLKSFQRQAGRPATSSNETAHPTPN